MKERDNKGSIIATINTSSAGLLARVVLALYYEFHVIRDGMHRELTVLQKLPTPCRAELLQVSSPTNTSACRANRGREGKSKERERDRERGGREGVEEGREGGRDEGRKGERERESKQRKHDSHN